MTINLKTLGILLIALGAAVLVLGRNFPGFWIYSVILIAFGASLFVKGNKDGNKK